MDELNVNGITITPDMEEVLSEWQNFDSDQSIPEEHINHLCNIQDHFCRQLHESDADIEMIGAFLRDIIYLKDDLKVFIVNKKGDSND